MTVSTLRATLPCDIRTVWNTVVDVRNYTWRSDLSRTEIIDGSRFIEYTRQGFPTAFTVTAVEPYERWESDMENASMRGHWIGIFTARGDKTEIAFTEHVTVRRMLLKPFAKPFLQGQQAQFIADLERELRQQKQRTSCRRQAGSPFSGTAHGSRMQ